MRRFLVSLSLLVAATAAAWVLVTPGAAARAQRPSLVACPQLASSQVISCCPVPPDAPGGSADVQPICCPASSSTACCTTSCCTTDCCTTDCCTADCCTADCCTSGCCTTGCCATTCCTGASACCTPMPCSPGSLTVGSSPDPSTSGRQVVISGVLSASPAAGAPVDLWRERAGQSSFQQIAQTTTGSSGAYTFTLERGVVLADQAFYVTSGTLQSATIDQHVRALVGMVPSSHSMLAGARVVLRGHVTPSHAGEPVLIEQSDGGAWRVIALARLSKGSNYTFSHRFTQTGRTRLRAVLQGDDRNVQSISPVVALTVTS